MDYGIGSTWSINVKNSKNPNIVSFYKGKIIEEDNYSIKIHTHKNEIMVFRKKDVSGKRIVFSGGSNDN